MVEIVPKPKEEVSIWLKILFYFSLIVLIGVILAFLILFGFYRKSEIYLKNLESKIYQLKTEPIRNLEGKLKETKKKIEDYSTILNQHIFASKFFKFLESNTHPKVSFSKMDLDVLNSKVSLSGFTESFTTLNQQIQIFEKSEEVKKINLTNISLFKEEKTKVEMIEFSLDLTLDPKVFHY
jgi:hypothetical protein